MSNEILTLSRAAAAAKLEDYFTNMLYDKLGVAERRTLYPFSSWFSKGLANSKAGNMLLADHYFREGERRRTTLSREGLLWQAIQNEYLPRKAYYLYKTGDCTAAEQLLDEAMGNMKKMEAEGWEHLVYYRVQQYHNLARMYFFNGRIDEATRIVADLLVFLLSGRTTGIPDLNVRRTQYPVEYAMYNYLFIVQIFFESLGVYLRRPQGPDGAFMRLLGDVIPAVKLYQPFIDDARVIKRCILLFEALHAGDIAGWRREAEAFLAMETGEQFAEARHYLSLYMEWNLKVAV